jgi:hypothetical protein
MHVGFRWESLMSKDCAILCAEREVSAISKSAAASHAFVMGAAYLMLNLPQS